LPSSFLAEIAANLNIEYENTPKKSAQMRIVELITLVASAAAASGASLQLVERFGLMNPTNLTMQIYVPEKLAQDQPSVLFAVCFDSSSTQNQDV
jgi:hypothetical protein